MSDQLFAQGVNAVIGKLDNIEKGISDPETIDKRKYQYLNKLFGKDPYEHSLKILGGALSQGVAGHWTEYMKNLSVAGAFSMYSGLYTALNWIGEYKQIGPPNIPEIDLEKILKEAKLKKAIEEFSRERPEEPEKEAPEGKEPIVPATPYGAPIKFPEQITIKVEGLDGIIPAYQLPDLSEYVKNICGAIEGNKLPWDDMKNYFGEFSKEFMQKLDTLKPINYTSKWNELNKWNRKQYQEQEKIAKALEKLGEREKIDLSNFAEKDYVDNLHKDMTGKNNTCFYELAKMDVRLLKLEEDKTY